MAIRVAPYDMAVCFVCFSIDDDRTAFATDED